MHSILFFLPICAMTLYWANPDLGNPTCKGGTILTKEEEVVTRLNVSG